METKHSESGRDPGPTYKNAYYPWNDFDSAAYLKHNYLTLRDDDRQIMEAVADYFAAADLGRTAQGLDVGSGTNLYPALTMLPFCAELTLWEYSASNVDWLRREKAAYSASWDPFWHLLAKRQPYRDVRDPRRALAKRVWVEQGSIFDLPKSSWDIGTMFFVAESLTAKQEEFELATRRFIEALRPDAPFAAAFMENSVGYDVGSIQFPAVAITVADVRSCLDGIASQLTVDRIDAGSDPVRTGYSGMIFALGRAPQSVTPAPQGR
jgi:hypothetical protein